MKRWIFLSLLTCNFYYKKIYTRSDINYLSVIFPPFLRPTIKFFLSLSPFFSWKKKNIIAILLKKERKYDTLYVFVENKFDIEERSVHAAFARPRKRTTSRRRVGGSLGTANRNRELLVDPRLCSFCSLAVHDETRREITAIRERSRIAKNQWGTALTGSSYRHSGYNRTRENFAADIEARVMTKVYRQTLDLMLFFKR